MSIDNNYVSFLTSISIEMDKLLKETEESRILSESGWHRIQFNYQYTTPEIKSWADNTIAGPYRILAGSILFLNDDDATLYKLRWQ